MRIQDQHYYHGAALLQVIEYKPGVSIDVLKLGDRIGHPRSHDTYRVDREIGLYVKYATTFFDTENRLCQFKFEDRNIDELGELQEVTPKTFLALVCEPASAICCLSFDEFARIYAERSKQGASTKSFDVVVEAPDGERLRVFAREAAKRGGRQAEIQVPRAAFPSKLFIRL